MELFGITVSTNYSDLLSVVIHQNYKFLTKWYIITSESDTKTIDVIRRANYSNIEILYYDFKTDGAIFNFGGARRYGQLYSIEKNGYNKPTVFLDSDIYLPDNFRRVLDAEPLNDITLYGITRRFDYATLSAFNRRETTHPYRWATEFQGFFQLFIQTPEKLYKSSVDCSECDLHFHVFFPRKKLLPLTLYHLGKSGIHWKGRSTYTDFLIDV